VTFGRIFAYPCGRVRCPGASDADDVGTACALWYVDQESVPGLVREESEAMARRGGVEVTRATFIDPL